MSRSQVLDAIDAVHPMNPRMDSAHGRLLQGEIVHRVATDQEGPTVEIEQVPRAATAQSLEAWPGVIRPQAEPS